MPERADWAGYCDRIVALLGQDRTTSITHTIERIKEEVGSPKSADELRDPNEWKYAAEGRRHFDTATKRNLVLIPHTDENGRVVAVSFQLANL